MASSNVSHSPLDDAVEQTLGELRSLGAPAPECLFLMAAGAQLLSDRLEDAGSIALDSLEDPSGLPELWRTRKLFYGRLGDSVVWVLEDVAGDPGGWEPETPWAAGMPCWLAAEAGARLCVHTAAGAALPATGSTKPPGVGAIGLASDHINLSGDSPLTAIGESRLGPLFPDLTRLHHSALRSAALRASKQLGIDAREVVVACTQGPSLETPAEGRWLANAGAEVALQGVAAPYLACAHAGLSLLAIAAVTSAGEDPIDVAQMVAASQAIAPALEDLLIALAPDFEAAAGDLRTEASL